MLNVISVLLINKLHLVVRCCSCHMSDFLLLVEDRRDLSVFNCSSRRTQCSTVFFKPHFNVNMSLILPCICTGPHLERLEGNIYVCQIKGQCEISIPLFFEIRWQVWCRFNEISLKMYVKLTFPTVWHKQCSEGYISLPSFICLSVHMVLIATSLSAFPPCATWVFLVLSFLSFHVAFTANFC